MNNRELLVNFVTNTFTLGDKEFKKLLEKLIEIRITTRLHRSNKTAYEDLIRAYKEYDAA